MREWLRPEITEVQTHPKAGNPRTVIMNKFLLAITLLVAFSAPASAMLGKGQSRPDQRHVVSTNGSGEMHKLSSTCGRSEIPTGDRATTLPHTAPTAASKSANIFTPIRLAPAL
jgi:hypothetical protein